MFRLKHLKSFQEGQEDFDDKVSLQVLSVDSFYAYFDVMGV